MSCQPKCSHSSRRRYPSTRSPQARVIGLGCAATSTIVIWPPEQFPPAQPSQPQPLQQTFRVATGYQEKPAEPQPLLDQQFAQTGLCHQVAAIAVGEVALGDVVGILRVHPAGEDRLELGRSARMQVSRIQAGSERQPGPDQPPMNLPLVAADEQPQIGNADRLERGCPKQG